MINNDNDDDYLPHDKHIDPTLWNGAKYMYTNDDGDVIAVGHVFPNDGKHLSNLQHSEDCLVESTCWCMPDHEEIRPGHYMISHNVEMKEKPRTRPKLELVKK